MVEYQKEHSHRTFQELQAEVPYCTADVMDKPCGAPSIFLVEAEEHAPNPASG
jgi:hypothetical protein